MEGRTALVTGAARRWTSTGACSCADCCEPARAHGRICARTGDPGRATWRTEVVSADRNRGGAGEMDGARLRTLLAALAVVVVTASAAAAGTARSEATATVRLAMISPLTGPLSFVGVDNRAGVLAAIREVNAQGGIKGRKIALDIFDDSSNPSQGVVHMQRIVGDNRYLGIIGSGFSSVGLAVAPIVAQAQIPYISMASSAAQVTPAKPYYFMTTATSRLFAYSMAQHLRKLGIRRVAVMADNGG